jgi:3-carboxy-cis,cis-muconate cycloisomerase
MPSDRLFGPASSTPAMLAVVDDVAWVAAMLAVEAALARASARVGLVPTAAADAIAACCQPERFDIARLGREAVDAGNPVIPLVKALTAIVPDDAAAYVHWGATSQDILDTAMMLVARRGLDLLDDDLGALAGAAATLAEQHRATLLPGRTLLQQALPTTFGLKAAGWLVAVLEARARLRDVAHRRLAVQLGGAVGTLAAFGDRGFDVVRALSAELDLAEPLVPWHTARGRLVELGTALALAAGTAGKIAQDIVLLAQSEVAEVSERRAPGRGGSSTLPQKRNPVGAVETLACVRSVNAQADILIGAMTQEHERAAGAWQAEWPALAEALRLTAGAVSRAVELLSGLDVHVARMRRNLDASGGLLMAESVMMALAPRIGRQRAQELVTRAAALAADSGRSLREALLAEPTMAAQLKAEELDAALDPLDYLGSAGAFIDRALAAYQAEKEQYP